MTENTYECERMEIIKKLNQLQPLVEGKVCPRTSKSGKVDGYRLQRRRDGKNDTRYLPLNKVEQVQEGIENFQQYNRLLQELIELDESQVLDGLGKKNAEPHLPNLQEAWNNEMQAFLHTAVHRLQEQGLGDIGWLEEGLREASNKACASILQHLLAHAATGTETTTPKTGQRHVKDLSRTIHTLFGPIKITRTWLQTTDAEGYFPMDEALGLINGYTPTLAALMARCAASEAFEKRNLLFVTTPVWKLQAASSTACWSISVPIQRLFHNTTRKACPRKKKGPCAAIS